jgi:hypothetical protein
MVGPFHNAEAFLSALAPDGELTFQTFDDAKSGARGLSRVLHGRFGQHANRLEDLNERGAGCFVMVNRGDMGGRKERNVQAVRALFLDLDGAPLEPVMAAPLPPPITCESSPGKYHAYWPVADMPLSAFRMAQRALAAKYGGDPKVCDLPRVMRMPGFLHRKATPYRSRLLHCDFVKPWIWSDFAECMGLVGQSPKPDAGLYVEGGRNDAMFRFACGLRSQGLPHDEALHRTNVANAGRCIPPLDGAEVAAIVSSAYKGDQKGFVALPNALYDSPGFQMLSSDAKVFVLALARKHYGSNNGRLTFTMEDAARIGMSPRRRRNAVIEATDSRIVDLTQASATGRPGHRATPDFFALPHLK